MPFKIIFFGTSEFAVPSLEALAKDGRFEIVGIVTQPDRPVGRHATLTPPAIKQFIVGAGFPRPSGRSAEPGAETAPLPEIQQPEKLKDEAFQSWIKEIGPSCDAFVIVSYGKILPQWLLDLPKKGVINVHGSLLPRWRGASPIQAAIAAGDKMSGVTVMLIDAEMDHGPILAAAEEPISAEDTSGSLHDRLAGLGAALLPATLAGYLEGTIEPSGQDHSLATSCKILTRDDGKLDFSKTSQEIERLVRAYDPWPGTWIDVDEKRLKILAARVSLNLTTAMDEKGNPIPPRASDRFVVQGRPHVVCAGGTSLELVTVQPEGKKPMSGEEFLRGQGTHFVA